MHLIKFLIIFISFFLIFYLESYFVSIGFPYFNLWKGVFVIVALLMIIFKGKIYSDKLVVSGFCFSFYSLLNIHLITNFLTNIVSFFKFSTFPSFYYLFKRYKISHFFILSICLSIILSSIPFLFMGMNSFGRQIDMETFGLEGQNSFVGLFLNPHSCSFITSLAFIVLFSEFKDLRFGLKYLFFAAILFIGLYVIFLTYVRTGYLMILFSIVVNQLFKKSSNFFYVFRSLIFISLGFLLLYYFIDSSFIINRILDKREFGNDDNLSNIGSGRLIIWSEGLFDWIYSQNLLQRILGLGFQGMLDMYNIKFGLAFVSHNQFLDILLSYGLLGFIFYSIFSYNIILCVLKNKNSLNFDLQFSLVISYLIFQFFQGGILFLPELILSYYLSQQKNN